MWLQRITQYLLVHRYQTIVLTFAITFLPIIGMVGILIAALVTLQKGIIEGAILTIAATLPYVISFYLTGHQEAALPIIVWAAIAVGVLSNILTWVFAAMLRKQCTWSFILQIAALVGVLAISVIHLIFPDVGGWWSRELQSYYAQAQALTGLLKNTSAMPSEAQLESISITKQYITGLMVVAILFNALLQLVVARWWQAALFTPGLLRTELHSIRLSQLAGVLFIVSIILSYFGNKVVLDIMPILYTLFTVAGLSLIHYLFTQTKSASAWLWLLILYMTLLGSLLFSQLTVLILISMFAFADIWLNIRKRYKLGV